jgi:hypothetical protein
VALATSAPPPGSALVSDCNSIEINFKYNLHNYRIIGIYSSPSLVINNFLMGIDSYLSNISVNDKVIICGDMNINILEKSSDVSNYLNIMTSYNFISCFDSYTRVTETTKSCIDHIFIRNIDISKANSFVIKTDITDHFSLTLFIKEEFIDSVKDNVRQNNFNNKKIINFNKLNILISSFDWHSLLINNDVDFLVDKFNGKINKLISDATKVTTISKSKFKKTHKIKIWITNGLLISIKNRQQLYKKKLNSPFDLKFKQYYVKYRNLLNLLIKKARFLYYSNLISLTKNNMKSTWKLINEVSYSTKKKEPPINCLNSLVSNTTLTKKSEILNELNNYYINDGKNIFDEINTSNYNKLNWNELNHNCHINDSIYLDPIYPIEISNFLR